MSIWHTAQQLYTHGAHEAASIAVVLVVSRADRRRHEVAARALIEFGKTCDPAVLNIPFLRTPGGAEEHAEAADKHQGEAAVPASSANQAAACLGLDTSEVEWIEEELMKIYIKHNPDKLEDFLIQLQTKYAGQERVYTRRPV